VFGESGRSSATRSGGRLGPSGAIDFVALRRLKLRSHPYPWTRATNLLSAEFERRLANTWPSRGFAMNERDQGSDKTYRIAMRSLQSPGALPILGSDLDEAWHAFVLELGSDAYRAAIETLTAIDLRPALLEVVLNEYRLDYFLAPHTDKFPKLVTQLFYFTESWTEASGGRLLILNQAGDVVDSVEPRCGGSAIIVRTEHSWHAVERVRDELGGVRRSVQVVFWGGLPNTSPGRITTPE